MCVTVVPEVEAVLMGCECFEDELHSDGGVGAEDDIELLWVGIEEAEDAEADVVDSFCSLLG